MASIRLFSHPVCKKDVDQKFQKYFLVAQTNLANDIWMNSQNLKEILTNALYLLLFCTDVSSAQGF